MSRKLRQDFCQVLYFLYKDKPEWEGKPLLPHHGL
jgi:hypothetical protein